MTINSNTTSFTLAPLTSGSNLAYPLGQYAAHASVVGDATGGVVTFDLAYRPGYIYSLEGIHAGKGPINSDVRVTWRPQIVFGSLGFVQSVDMNQNFSTYDIIGRDMAFHWPLSTAHRASIAGVTASITFDINSNLETYRGAFWGY